MAQERLQKVLARAGLASRRGAEQIIAAGRVRINGRVVTEPGTKADPKRQEITVDGKVLESEPLLYVLFHKPRGVVCTMVDPEGRETVAAYMSDVGGRVVPVGRLDFHTSGVLLLTNDGDFSATLLHPKHHIAKTYVAKVKGLVGEPELEQWRKPIEIDGRMTQSADVRRLRVEGEKTWLEITLHEGRNRHIHRLGDATGNTVLRLARLSFAGIDHEGLRPGHWRYLSQDELGALKRAHGVPKRIWLAPPLPNQSKIRKARANSSGTSDKGVVDGTPRRAARDKRSQPRVDVVSRQSAPRRANGSLGHEAESDPRVRLARSVEGTDRTGRDTVGRLKRSRKPRS